MVESSFSNSSDFYNSSFWLFSTIFLRFHMSNSAFCAAMNIFCSILCRISTFLNVWCLLDFQTININCTQESNKIKNWVNSQVFSRSVNYWPYFSHFFWSDKIRKVNAFWISVADWVIISDKSMIHRPWTSNMALAGYATLSCRVTVITVTG